MDARTQAQGADIQKAARFLAEGRAQEAATVLEHLARTFPAYVTAHVLLAKAYETTGREADALNAWHQAYFLMPGSPLIVRQRTRLIQRVTTAPAPEAAAPAAPAPAPAPAPVPEPATTSGDWVDVDVSADAGAEPLAEWVPVPDAQPEAQTEIPPVEWLDDEELEAIAPPPSEDQQRRAEDWSGVEWDRAPAGEEAPSAPEWHGVDEEVSAPPAGEEAPIWSAPPESGDSRGAPEHSWRKASDEAPPEDGWRVVDEFARDQDFRTEAEATVHPPAGTRREETTRETVEGPPDEPEPREDIGGSAIPDLEAPAAAETPGDEWVDLDIAPTPPFATGQPEQDRPPEEPRQPGKDDFMQDVTDLDALIDRLEKAPRIRPAAEDEADPGEDEFGDDEIVSETLARIYEAQKQYAAAARAYDLLVRQHPDRAEEFARRAAEMRVRAGG